MNTKKTFSGNNPLILHKFYGRLCMLLFLVRSAGYSQKLDPVNALGTSSLYVAVKKGTKKVSQRVHAINISSRLLCLSIFSFTSLHAYVHIDTYEKIRFN